MVRAWSAVVIRACEGGVIAPTQPVRRDLPLPPSDQFPAADRNACTIGRRAGQPSCERS